MLIRSMRIALLGALGFLPVAAFADLPLTVEGMLSAQNKWRAELGINYANLEQRGVSTGQSIAVQVAPAQFVLAFPRFFVFQRAGFMLPVFPSVER